ncbi:MAG: class I SAM-dependent methyltransferase [Deltaproteobacteria bacterium]|jgi:hypothetical protein|nr:class I SAM-dependent methyltransferase [Deltaproteobacteria bacterium]
MWSRIRAAGAAFFPASACRAAASLAAGRLRSLPSSPPAPILVLGSGHAVARQALALAKHGFSCVKVNCSAGFAGRTRQVAQLTGAAVSSGGSLLHAASTALPFTDKAFALAVSSSLLARLDSEACFRSLDELFRVSPRLILLERRLPERNLDYPFYLLLWLWERAAGTGSYRAFDNFVRLGGPEGIMQRYILYREQSGLPGCSVLERRFPALNRLLLLTEVRE